MQQKLSMIYFRLVRPQIEDQISHTEKISAGKIVPQF